jgi:tetratricopeptide (TPR) repeat protein
MFRKNYFTFLWVIVLFLSAGLTILAQTAPVRGRVELKKADGTTEKLSKATIDVYRTDAKGKLPSDKTDKNGGFGFAGFTAGQTYALVVSAPGIKSEIFPNVRAGMENIVITVYEGDGKRWTEDEVRSALAGSQNAPVGSTQGQAAKTETAQPQMTAEQKKAEAEYQKQVADVTAKNEKIKSTSASIQKSLTEGNNAFKEKNYDLAISKFDEGINAEPDFAGSAPVLLNAKGAALKERGFISYTQGAKSTDAAIKASMFESAKKDWNAAADALTKGLAILKTATAPDAESKKNYDTNKEYILTNLVEVHRLMSRSTVDRSKAVEAKAAYEEYFAVETDAAAKSKAQLNLADILREAGDSENAVIAYRKVLETSPDNPDALSGIGLSLFNSGVIADNKEQKQEGMNFMQKFADTAPDTHPLKASVRDAIEYLKTTDKITPQKTGKSVTTKKKP